MTLSCIRESNHNLFEYKYNYFQALILRLQNTNETMQSNRSNHDYRLLLPVCLACKYDSEEGPRRRSLDLCSNLHP